MGLDHNLIRVSGDDQRQNQITIKHQIKAVVHHIIKAA